MKILKQVLDSKKSKEQATIIKKFLEKINNKLHFFDDYSFEYDNNILNNILTMRENGSGREIKVSFAFANKTLFFRFESFTHFSNIINEIEKQATKENVKDNIDYIVSSDKELDINEVIKVLSITNNKKHIPSISAPNIEAYNKGRDANVQIKGDISNPKTIIDIFNSNKAISNIIANMGSIYTDKNTQHINIEDIAWLMDAMNENDLLEILQRANVSNNNIVGYSRKLFKALTQYVTPYIKNAIFTRTHIKNGVASSEIDDSKSLKYITRVHLNNAISSISYHFYDVSNISDKDGINKIIDNIEDIRQKITENYDIGMLSIYINDNVTMNINLSDPHNLDLAGSDVLHYVDVRTHNIRDMGTFLKYYIHKHGNVNVDGIGNYMMSLEKTNNSKILVDLHKTSEGDDPPNLPGFGAAFVSSSKEYIPGENVVNKVVSSIC